jgi:hypothetical protein
MVWKLSDKFALDVIHSKPYDVHTQYGHCFFASRPPKDIRIEHVESKQTDVLPLVFESDLNESFTIQLYVVKYSITFSQRVIPPGQVKAQWNPHTHHPIVFALTVADLFRVYHYVRRGESDAINRDVSVKKKSLIDTAFKSDDINDHLNIIGFLRNGHVYKTDIVGEYQKNGLDIKKFLESKILFYCANSRGRDERVMRSINRELLGQSIMNLATNDLINALVQYYYWGKSLVIPDDTITFDIPITMREFIAHIEDDYGIHDPNPVSLGHMSGLKEWLIDNIFKECNSHEAEVLSKHAEGAIVIDNADQIPENVPPAVFRTFHFSKFSKDIVSGIVYALTRAIRNSRVPKRWKQPLTRDRYVAEGWKYEKTGDRYYYGPGYRDEIQKENEKYTKTQIKEAVSLGFASCSSSSANDREDENTKYAYELPPILDDPNLLAGLDFLTDEEILQECTEIDNDRTSSLMEKVDRLNLMAYSRAACSGGMYQLLLPGAGAISAIYDEFFKPSVDLRLPTICLLKI